MNSKLAKWRSRNFLLFILFLQSIAYAIVFFDVPVARQVIGFIYLTFVPGFVIIKLLKLDELGGLETVLFSVGLSVAFLMLAGFLLNEFGFLFGFSKPLSLMPLMIVLNSLVLIGGVLVYLRREDVKFLGVETLGLSPLALLFIVLPVLSVVGAVWVNVYENNLILLFLMIAISLLFVVGLISKKLLPPKLYSLAVLVIALSLLFHSSLISNYLISHGSDIPGESFVSRTTQNNARWASVSLYSWDQSFSRLNAMLSVTILPTIYSILLNMDVTWVLKVLYPLIFSFVPLVLYQLWQKILGKKRAFIAAFLLMAESTFFTELLGLGRQMVAELFFVLLLLVVLNKEMKPFKKTVCFMIFSCALIVSHYALAEIFLLFISLAWISLVAMKRSSRKITVSIVALFFILMFSWYIYTSNSAVFDSFVSFGNYVYDQLNQFFNPESRGQTVLRGLGLESPPSIWNTFSRAFAYITEFFIAVGFVGLITRRTKAHRDREHLMLTSIAIALLGALILVPGLANTMNITRFYHILLFFLAPLCVLGVEVLVKLVCKREKELMVSVLLLIVLVPYFLFQTGFVYEVTESESWSVPLSKYRMDGYRLYRGNGYIEDLSVFGAQWMWKNVDFQRAPLYADLSSTYNVLTSYGYIYRGYVRILSNTTKVPIDGTVYLSPLNTVHRMVAGKSYLYNLSELSFVDDMNKIYSNGGSEIYQEPIGE